MKIIREKTVKKGKALLDLHINYYAFNKGQPLHLDIDTDLDQIELDREVFQDDAEDETSQENIVLEDKEMLKATESALSKVCILAVKFSYSGPLMFMLATLHYK